MQIKVGNHSNADLNSVIIDSTGFKTQVGFVPSSKTKEAGIDYCDLRFWKGFAIEWEEKGIKHKAVVDIMSYQAKLDQIKSMGFYYLGNDKWKVIARDGTRVNSREISP